MLNEGGVAALMSSRYPCVGRSHCRGLLLLAARSLRGDQGAPLFETPGVVLALLAVDGAGRSKVTTLFCSIQSLLV